MKMYKNINSVKEQVKSFYFDVLRKLGGITRLGNVDESTVSRGAKKVKVFVGFSEWKHSFYCKVFRDSDLRFIAGNESAKLTEILREFGPVEVVIWGYSESEKVKGVIKKKQVKASRLEDGFIRSFGLGACHALPLSYVYDTSGVLYFDSSMPSQLEELLSTYDFLEEDLCRAQGIIKRLKGLKITKYNSRVLGGASPLDLSDSARSILCVGQVEDDASIKYGSKEVVDNLMLVERVSASNPDSVIYFRPHPDTIKGGRAVKSPLSLIQQHANVLYGDESIVDLIDQVDEVHTITSLVGFEALLRGKEVHTYGQPFYSGWGLTVDHAPLARRSRKLTVDQLFFCAYILYPRYLDTKFQPTSIEATISGLEAARVDGNAVVARIRAERAQSVSHEKTVAWAFRFGAQMERLAVAAMFPEYEIKFAPVNAGSRSVPPELKVEIERDVDLGLDVHILIWGYLAPSGTVRLANRLGVPIYRVEDSFIRSIGLGGDLDSKGNVRMPISVVKDSSSIYYNCHEPSDVELILNDYRFSEKDIEYAKECIGKLISNGITKYNKTIPSDFSYPEGDARKVLVLGQVESDASIKYGTDRPISMNDLVRIAHRENPQADIYYKPHPAVFSGVKENESDPRSVAHLCDFVDGSVSLPEALVGVDHVYVLSSGSGFEALLRGISVTCFGANFYSGWGLTDDRMELPRRMRHLSVEELFYAFYCLYTRYYDHVEGCIIDCSAAIDLIADQKVQEYGSELLNAARKSMALGNSIAASGLLLEFLSIRENFEARGMLAKCYELMGWGEQAYHEYAKLLQVYPFDDDIRLRCLFLEAYYFDGVLEAYLELVEIMSRSPELISNNLAMRVIALHSMASDTKMDCVNSYYLNLNIDGDGVHVIDVEIKQRLEGVYGNV
jgi:capsular polysaccharide export protein